MQVHYRIIPPTSGTPRWMIDIISQETLEQEKIYHFGNKAEYGWNITCCNFPQITDRCIFLKGSNIYRNSGSFDDDAMPPHWVRLLLEQFILVKDELSWSINGGRN